MFYLNRNSFEKSHILALSLVLLSSSMAAAGGGNEFDSYSLKSSASSQISAEEDPKGYFLQTYGEMTVIQNTDSVVGKKVAIIFHESFKETAIVEGILKNKISYTWYDYGGDDHTGYKYVVQLLDDSKIEIRASTVIEFRADITKAISAEEFDSSYADWHDARDFSHLLEKTGAFLVRISDSSFKLIEGKILSAPSRSGSDTEVYKVKTNEGDESIDLNSVESIKIKPMVRILK